MPGEFYCGGASLGEIPNGGFKLMQMAVSLQHKRRNRMQILRQATAVDVLIGSFLNDIDGNTAKTGLTIEAADVLLSKNGQALTLKADVTACVHDAGGNYNCELDATDTDTVGQLTLFVHVSGALAVRHDFQIMEESSYDDLYGVDASIRDAVWDEILTGATHNITNSAGKLLRQAGIITATDASVDDPGAAATTTVFNTTLTDVDDFWNDAVIIFTSGALEGQSRTIIDFANTNGQITIDEALTSIPADAVTFTLASWHVHPVSQIAAAVTTDMDANSTQLAAIITDTAAIIIGTSAILDDTVDIQSRLPAALVSGLMSSDVTAISTSATAANNLELSTLVIVPGIATGTPTTTTMAASALTEGTDDHYNSRLIIWTSGDAKDIVAEITSYEGTTKTFTFTETATACVATDTFIIV